MRVRLTELAIGELAATRDHYPVIDEELEHRFLDQFDLVVDRLLAFPYGAPPVDGFPASGGLRCVSSRTASSIVLTGTTS